jgi:microsomal prostaglandin-E synthase 2
MKGKSLPKLFQYAVCPFCCKVVALLSYKKIPYEAVEVHPLNKKEIKFSADYKKVPILVDTDGTQINDSTPIMRYLDSHYGAAKVFETAPEAREEEDAWLKWADEILVRALPPLIYRNVSEALQAFDYITKEGKFGWLQQRLIKYSGALVMTLVAKKSAKAQGITKPQKHLEQCLDQWAEALGEREYLGGDHPNGADLAVFGILRSIEEMPAFQLIQNHPAFFDWYQRVEGAALLAA